MAADTPLVLLQFFGSSHRESGLVRARLVSDRRVLAGIGDAGHRAPRVVNGMAEDDGISIDAALASCALVGHSKAGTTFVRPPARRRPRRGSAR